MLCCAVLWSMSTGSRFINSSNQLFERQSDIPVPFSELHACQVNTSNTGPVPTHIEHAQAAWEATGQAQQKPLRFALDLSAIDESETDSEAAPTAPAAAATGPAAASAHANAGDDTHQSRPDVAAVMGGACARLGTYHPYPKVSECMVSSSGAAGSSGHSTGGQQAWSLELHQIQDLLDAAMQHMHVQQQQQQPGGDSTPNPAQQQQQQQMGGQGSQPPRKLVRPSLCSDAGSTPQQHARSAAQQQQQQQQQTGTTSAAAPAVPGAVGEDVAVKLQGLTEQHMQQYAAQPLASSETGGALCGTKRKFVLDLSDP